jgi:hypothetical protein
LESPYGLESLGGGIEEEDEDEEKGDVTPLPHSLPPKISPSSVTSSVSKWGSPLARARQNGPKQVWGIIWPTTTVWSCTGIF